MLEGKALSIDEAVNISLEEILIEPDLK